MATGFDYEPGQPAKARIFGGWKHVTVEAVNGNSSVRVSYEQGANRRSVTIYDNRLIKPCQSTPPPIDLMLSDQQSLDL